MFIVKSGFQMTFVPNIVFVLVLYSQSFVIG